VLPYVDRYHNVKSKPHSGKFVAQSVQIKSVKAWHEELIDFMLAQPRAGLKETSEFFGVSMSWLSIVKNSDAFQNEWDKRRAEHSSAVSVSIVERVEALAEVALETMTEKLEREGAAVGLTTLREISETALKSLGFGQRSNVPAQNANNITNNNMIVVDRETLARAREARTRMQLNNETPSLESPSSNPLVVDAKVEDTNAGEGQGREEARFGPSSSLPEIPRDSIPEIRRTQKEAKKIFKDLFGSDIREGD
jgi:hypothetical protein